MRSAIVPSFLRNTLLSLAIRWTLLHDSSSAGTHVSTRGGSAALLSGDVRERKTGDDPPLCATSQPHQFARRHLRESFPTPHIFDHKCSLDPPSTNIANHHANPAWPTRLAA